MKFQKILFIASLVGSIGFFATPWAVQAGDKPQHGLEAPGFTNAREFGFSPQASGMENTQALQKALDNGGTIMVSQVGTYDMADTVFIGSHTTLIFCNGVTLRKVADKEPFSHVILNKGALTKTYDTNIVVQGLTLMVNNVDIRTHRDVYGLIGQVAFFYVKDLQIERFRCMDLMPLQYGIHVCTFEDLTVDDVIIKGMKDGVHLGRGKRFTIRNAVFQTYDDAIALNAHDYDTGNPELGWIENGLVENCRDLNDKKTVGFFCRILAGSWLDWKAGMEVQKSDTVVSNGRMYRVFDNPTGKFYTSTTQPTHVRGKMKLDGIQWVMIQEDVTYSAGVRNVTFRDIFLEKPRVGFSIHFDSDKFSRSWYPGSKVAGQEQLVLDNIKVIHHSKIDLISSSTPIDVVTISNSSLRNTRLRFFSREGVVDTTPTKINMVGCVFNATGPMELLLNKVKDKNISLKTTASVEMSDKFSATVTEEGGTITVDSDLTGLKKK